MEEALNVESVDSENGLDLDLVMVVVGYEFITGDDWGVGER